MKTDKLTRRSFLRAAAAAASGVALAACVAPAAPAPSQPSEAPTTPPEAPAEAPTEAPAPAAKTELVLWGWWDLRMAIYENTAKQFMELNPDVTIKVETLPGTDELQQKVYSSVAAGTGPDMLKMSEFFFKMRDQDLLLEWPEDLFPNSWFTEMYPNVNWDAYGRYVVPTGSCGTLLVYNKKMFEEAGIAKVPASWDEVKEAAKKLTKPDRAGIVRQVWRTGDRVRSLPVAAASAS